MIKSKILGALRFRSIISSSPLPIDITKNSEGSIPKRVDQKKLNTFTSNIHGKTFYMANGIPPINL